MNNKLLKFGMTAGGGLIAGGTALLASGQVVPGVIMIVIGSMLGGGSALKHPGSASTPIGEDNEDPIPPSKRKPGALLVLVAAGMLAHGCATFAASRDACLAGTETHNKAIQMVVPHLAKAMTCAAENVENDEAAVMCVQNEFESLKSEAEPIVYACALALIGDVVQAKK